MFESLKNNFNIAKNGLVNGYYATKAYFEAGMNLLEWVGDSSLWVAKQTGKGIAFVYAGTSMVLSYPVNLITDLDRFYRLAATGAIVSGLAYAGMGPQALYYAIIGNMGVEGVRAIKSINQYVKEARNRLKGPKQQQPLGNRDEQFYRNGQSVPARSLVNVQEAQQPLLMNGFAQRVNEAQENLQRLAEQQAAQRQAAERQAAERQAAERQAAERQAAERQAAERQAAERQAAERQAAERQAAERQAAERQAAEQQAAELARIQALAGQQDQRGEKRNEREGDDVQEGQAKRARTDQRGQKRLGVDAANIIDNPNNGRVTRSRKK